jgi:chromosome partitioning protein
MNIISCYSIKGGVGKTALAVNLAFALQRAGFRTLLVDLDPQGAAAFYYKVGPAEHFELKNAKRMADLLRQNIRESDYPGLDVLPSNLAYRNFDLMLDRLKKSKKQLRRMLKTLRKDYDLLVLDCPPNITLLSENVFGASDMILVPVIPTILSERTLNQLVEFFKEKELPGESLLPFFSMAQAQKTMHREIMASLRERFPSFLSTVIPFASEVEKMGLHCRPVMEYAKSSPSAQAYRSLCAEILARLELRAPQAFEDDGEAGDDGEVEEEPRMIPGEAGNGDHDEVSESGGGETA